MQEPQIVDHPDSWRSYDHGLLPDQRRGTACKGTNCQDREDMLPCQKEEDLDYGQ